ncbi:hypothetical protein O3M35_006726 [Rhynocoris fuscipes]|uniref:Uncharacterized protein n=1 Tax=Rhynocoris fuscipes TaxID=488301 RepID=A0AAW1DH14_9HEMI
MLIVSALMLCLVSIVAAFRDHGGAICNKVCTTTSKCIKKLDVDNNLICEDIEGLTQAKCALLCSERKNSENVKDHHGDNIEYTEANHDLDSNNSFKSLFLNLVRDIFLGLTSNYAPYGPEGSAVPSDYRVFSKLSKKRIKRTAYGSIGGGIEGGGELGGGLGGQINARVQLGATVGGEIEIGLGPQGVYGDVHGGASGIASIYGGTDAYSYGYGGGQFGAHAQAGPVGGIYPPVYGPQPNGPQSYGPQPYGPQPYGPYG